MINNMNADISERMKREKFDLALKYDTLYKDTLDDLKYAKKVIDIKDLENKVKMINNNLKEELNNYQLNTISLNNTNNFQIDYLENIYSKYIKELEIIQNNLKERDFYIKIYYQIKEIENLIYKDNLNSNDLKSISQNIIIILKNINYDNTHILNEAVINKLYDLVYEIIKLELIYEGKSSLFVFCLNNTLSEHYLNFTIKKDIEKYQKENNQDEMLDLMLAKLDVKGVDRSYLDENLIIYLMLNKNEDYQTKIIDKLNHLRDKLRDNEELLDSEQGKIFNLRKNIESIKTNILGEISYIMANIAVFAGISVGSYFLSNKDVYEYEVDSEIYSTSNMIQTDVPNVTNKKEKDHTSFYVYEPWRYDKETKKYVRDVTTYNFTKKSEEAFKGLFNNIANGIEDSKVFNSNMQLDTLNDVLELFSDSSSLSPKTKKETKKELTMDDIYNESIKELIIIKQDPNKKTYVGQDFIIWRLLLFLLIGYVVLILNNLVDEKLLHLSFISAFGRIKEKINNKKEKKKLIEELKEEAKLIKKYADNNEEYREAFLNLYQKFNPYLQAKEFDDEYTKLIRQKNNN